MTIFDMMNENMDEKQLVINENGKRNMFAHMKNLQAIRFAPTNISSEKLMLENIAAYNVHLDVGDNKTTSIVTLREVPAFLIEAFSRFGQLNGCAVEGIFRKEGNSSRLKEGAIPVFYGAQRIPSTFHVHDVCVWIKRFFRELKKPLFVDSVKEFNLIKAAQSLTGDALFESIMKTIGPQIPPSHIVPIPTSHMAALAYLMRCLQEIAEKSDVHQMTIENLSTVFAPSLFRGGFPTDPKLALKQKSGSQEDLLNDIKKTNELQVIIVKALIEHADMIGIEKDYYKASRRPSDLLKKDRRLISSSMQKNQEAVKPHMVGIHVPKHSRSITNLMGEPSIPSKISMPHLDNERKEKNRSSSVVRAFGAIKKNFKKSLTSRTTSIDPPGLPVPPNVASKELYTQTNGNLHPEYGSSKAPMTGIVNQRIQQFKDISISKPGNSSSKMQLPPFASSSNSSSAFKSKVTPVDHGPENGWNKATNQSSGPLSSSRSQKSISNRPPVNDPFPAFKSQLISSLPKRNECGTTTELENDGVFMPNM